MQVYYPAMACNFTLRFDEALLGGSAAPPPKTPRQAAEAATPAAGGATEKAELVSGRADNLTHVLAVVPRTATVELPSPRQSPKFTLTFPFRDFPLDPRALRAASVEVFLGTVPAADFSRGVLGEEDGGRLASQLTLSRGNLLMVGLVNSASMTHSERGSEVRLEGTGLQSLFLSEKTSAEALAKLDLRRPVNDVVAQVLAVPGLAKRVPVRVQAEDWPFGVPVVAAQEILTRALQGADGKGISVPPKGSPSDLSYWDVVTTVCNLVGAVPYFIGHELWIRPARSIFEQRNAGILGQTPFAGGRPRTVAGPGGFKEDVSYRKMVYGRNLLSYTMERKYFTEGTLPTVRVVSVDTSSKERGRARLLEVTHPPEEKEEARAGFVAPSGKSADSNVLTIPVPGIRDKARLREIAVQLYEEIARGEVGGSFSTRDLASLGGGNGDADLLRLRPGDAIEFAVDSSGLLGVPPVASELTNAAAASVREVEDSVARRMGGKRDLARVLVGTARGEFATLQDVFRVSNVRYSWDSGSGVSVDADFHNYVTARSDAGGSSGVGTLADFTPAFLSTSGGTA